MFNIFNRQNKSEMSSVLIGEKYILKPDGSPWERTKDPVCIKIIDVKNGWVRYFLSESFPDQRMSIDMFLRIYQKV